MGNLQPCTFATQSGRPCTLRREPGLARYTLHHEEIYNVVKSLSADKAPRLDGFNNDFIKKCWPIIAPDFYAIPEGFQRGEICLQIINGSYITFKPKIGSPLA